MMTYLIYYNFFYQRTYLWYSKFIEFMVYGLIRSSIFFRTSKSFELTLGFYPRINSHHLNKSIDNLSGKSEKGEINL